MSAEDLDLAKGETPLWQGHPSHTGKAPGTTRIFAVFGWAFLVMFAFLALISWANRDEIGNMGSVLGIFLGLTGGLGAVFAFVLPARARRALAATRYAVTTQAAYILHPGGRTERRALDKHKSIKRVKDAGGGQKVLFIFPADRVIRKGTQKNRIKIPPTGFLRLTEEDAAAAEAALIQLRRGKGAAA